MKFSVGLGLTNDCNLACGHCYRPRGTIHHLTLQDVKMICSTIEVGSVGLGTGENGLNPEFYEIIAFFRKQKIPVTLASNGYTVQNTPDELLTTFREIEFSIDFPTAKEQDAFRGQGNWNRILSSIERCRQLGIEVSILAVLMNINHAKLGKLAKMVASFGCNLRINVFQPVRNQAYMPSYREYWDAFRMIFDSAAVISCTEPLVNTFSTLNSLSGSPCGRSSIRVTPLKHVLPCVYWPKEAIDLDELARLGDKVWDCTAFQEARRVPKPCRTCPYVQNCHGGCRSRALLLDRINRPDIYCPKCRGEDVRLFPDLLHENRHLRATSICTTIVRG